MSSTFNKLSCLNNGSVWEILLLAVIIRIAFFLNYGDSISMKTPSGYAIINMWYY